MTKREWKRQIWQAMCLTLWSDLKVNGAHYLYFDDHAEPISDAERTRMKEAALEVMATMKRFTGK